MCIERASATPKTQTHRWPTQLLFREKRLHKVVLLLSWRGRRRRLGVLPSYFVCTAAVHVFLHMLRSRGYCGAFSSNPGKGKRCSRAPPLSEITLFSPRHVSHQFRQTGMCIYCVLKRFFMFKRARPACALSLHFWLNKRTLASVPNIAAIDVRAPRNFCVDCPSEVRTFLGGRRPQRVQGHRQDAGVPQQVLPPPKGRKGLHLGGTAGRSIPFRFYRMMRRKIAHN